MRSVAARSFRCPTRAVAAFLAAATPPAATRKGAATTAGVAARQFGTQQPPAAAALLRSPLRRTKSAISPTARTTTTFIEAGALVVDDDDDDSNKVVNLSTIPLSELETLIGGWGYPKYRAKQVYQWVHDHGVLDIMDGMSGNVPLKLRQQLQEYCKPHALEVAHEAVSRKDGTVKRAYKCRDGQLIESVLMPYSENKYTACISSQAGCAQGCVFCATGQMGFARQLTSDEIVEQVSRFVTMLKRREKEGLKQQQQQKGDNSGVAEDSPPPPPPRLRSVVFMGMGEPLANYRNVVDAVQRITRDFGIGARRITVSTVGVVPNIRKLTSDPNMPPVRLAVSLHCATDEERTALLPANRRYGGLEELMMSLKEYIDTTGRRITLEWALVDGQNDGVDTARALGRLVTKQYNLRRDMVHVNVIPLNPTGGFPQGRPTNRRNVDAFCRVLQDEFGVACTPRMRRGIDIDAGCGQLKAKVLLEKEGRREEEQVEPFNFAFQDDTDKILIEEEITRTTEATTTSFEIDEDAVDFENFDDYDDPEFQDWQLEEASRLISLVKGTTVSSDVLQANDSGDDSAASATATVVRTKNMSKTKPKQRKRQQEQQLP